MKSRTCRPIWPVALLSVAGLVVSGYLWYGTGGAELRLCPAGSGCQVVQGSRYAYLLGVPLPVYGLAYYGTLLVASCWSVGAVRPWRVVLSVSAAGSAAFLVFLGVQRFVLHAFCSLCVASALISFVLLGLSWAYARTPVRWPTLAVPALAALIFVVGGYAVSERKVAASAYAEGLAKHLAASGAKFYGAYWCPHCTEQKRMFGDAARYLTYVECDGRAPEGRREECRQ
ncbi:MAG: vitamin K epoxide reductase family protein, partial [Armatimonadota bacterium]|nr:vitamin K epoxide reductase family protein [Armatimonadota bacterium]